jgi:hypothetical protein
MKLVNLHFAVRCGNHLWLHCGLGYNALLLRLPNDKGSKCVGDDFHGELARVCFSPGVSIGVAYD